MPQIKEDQLISEAYKKLYEVKSNLDNDNIPFKQGDIAYINSLDYIVMVNDVIDGQIYLSVIVTPDQLPDVRTFVYLVSDITNFDKKGERGDPVDIGDTMYICLSTTVSENKDKNDIVNRYKVILRVVKPISTMIGGPDSVEDMKLIPYYDL
jgi:hypothetical protein